MSGAGKDVAVLLDASVALASEDEQPVRAVSSTRYGGVSTGDYRSLNLSMNVGDETEQVQRNRQIFSELAGLPQPLRLARQVHGTGVVEAGFADHTEADAVYSNRPGQVCAVGTADCLPILLAGRGEVAAVHAGWRGLAAGVVEAALNQFCTRPDRITAWMGPAIGAEHFEVGPEVREVFLKGHPGAMDCFHPLGEKYLADLYQLAAQRLSRAGIGRISGGGFCTFEEADRFFSYRRDGRTGRMVSAIWMQPRV